MLVLNMSAGSVSQEKKKFIVPTFSGKTRVLFQAASEEHLFPTYATLPLVTVSEKYFYFFLGYAYRHRNRNKEIRVRVMSPV